MPTYDIRGVRIDFPFEAYSPQLAYMEKVVLALEQGTNALLESPTGTGKTLCLLCAALGWRRMQIEKAKVAAQRCTKQRVPRIIYASRTHSQLTQVVRELRRTIYKPLVCVLGSREQLCCHTEVGKLTGAAQAAGCQALTASKGCSFYAKLVHTRQVEKNLLNTVGSRSSSASLSGLAHPLADVPEERRPVPDIEDFIGATKKEGLCPFYYARELQAVSEVLFLPYNYLLDPKTRGALNINLAQDILIFDEAHNVDKVCAEASSISFSTIEIAGAVSELDRCIEGARNHRVFLRGNDLNESMVSDTDGVVDAGELARIKQILLNMNQTVAGLPLALRRGEPWYVGDGAGFGGLLAKAGITADDVPLICQQMERCVRKLGETVRLGISSGANFHLSKLVDVLHIAFEAERPVADYRLCVQEVAESDPPSGHGKRPRSTLDAGSTPRPRTVNYWCMHSGAAMRALVAMGVRSVLLTSGTLSPLSSFADELGVPFPHRLESPHVIDAQRQLMVGVFAEGPSGKPLTSAYTQRDSDDSKLDLGNALINFCRLIPQGVLVFFPSYAALASACHVWQQPGADGRPSILDRIQKLKTLVVEPRDSNKLAASLATYRGAVESSVRHRHGGAVLLAVCRGKVSEGVDFADAACRGVVITGLPLPPIVDARVELKRSYLDQRKQAVEAVGKATAGPHAASVYGSHAEMPHDELLTGEEWYQQQGMRAVNQAVGRVIRHINDYGVVLLCESRFQQCKWKDGLSLWLRPHVQQFTSFSKGVPAVQLFFCRCIEAYTDADADADGSAAAASSGLQTDGRNEGGGDEGSGGGATCGVRRLPHTILPQPPRQLSLLTALSSTTGCGSSRCGLSGAPGREAGAMGATQGKGAIEASSHRAGGAIIQSPRYSSGRASYKVGGRGEGGGASAAAKMYREAHSQLDEQAFLLFQGLLRDLSALQETAKSKPLPTDVFDRDQLRAVFAPPTHSRFLGMFLDYPAIRAPPHLQSLRVILRELQGARSDHRPPQC